jgi:hypothetical protein
MNSDPRKTAQDRANRIAAFRAELAQLENEQALTLTPDQRSRLERHQERLLSDLSGQFGIDASESAKRISWGMRLASLLGGAALLAALILFLHRIWGNLPSLAHVLVLTACPLALLLAAEVAYCRKVALYYVGLLALAAGVGFLLELGALGAVLNLVDSPHALLVWGLFGLLVAHAYRLRLLLAAGSILVCAYTAGLALSVQGCEWTGFFQQPQYLLPAAAILYALPLLTKEPSGTDFHSVYRLSGAGTALGALLVLSTAGDLCCGGLSPGTVEGLYQIIGLFASAGIVFHGVRLGRGGLVNLGVVAFVVFLYIRLQAWWWQWMPKYLFFLLIGLIAIALLLVFRSLRARLSQRSQP